MPHSVTLTNDRSIVDLKCSPHFHELKFLSANQIHGNFRIGTKPVIKLKLLGEEKVINLCMNLKPTNDGFHCFDVMETFAQLNFLNPEAFDGLEISIDKKFYDDAFLVELELDYC
jgi:hypothetical protein